MATPGVSIPTGALSAPELPNFVSQPTGEGLPDRCDGARVDVWCKALPDGAIARLGSPGGDVGSHLAIAPNGKRWVTADHFANICFWNGETGFLDACAKPIEASSRDAGTSIVDLAFTADGARLVVLGYREVLILSAATGDLEERVPLEGSNDDQYIYASSSFRAESITTAPKGDRFAIGVCSERSSSVVRVYDAKGTRLAAYEVPPEKEHEVCASAVAFSPNGKLLAAARKNLVLVWDEKGEIVTTIDTTDTSIEALAFSPDGAELAMSGWGDAINAVSTSTWKITRSFGFVRGSHNGTEGMEYSPDGKLLAATQGADTRVWDVASSGLVARLARTRPAMFSPNGDLLAIGTRGTSMVGRYTMPTGERKGPFDLSHHGDAVRAIAARADGKVAATAARDGVRTWELPSGKPLRFFLGPDGAQLRGLGFVKSGAVVGVTEDARVHVIDVDADAGAAPAPLGLLVGADDVGVRGVATSAGSDVVAIALDDGTLRRWNAATHEELPAIRVAEPGAGMRTEELSAPAVSRDGSLIAIGVRGEVWLVDAASGAVKHRIQLLESEWVVAVAFSPDRDALAILARERAVLIDLQGSPKLTLAVDGTHGSGTIAFAAGSTRLVVADRTVSVYDATKGTRLAGTKEDLAVSATLAAGGAVAAVGLDDGTAIVIDLAAGGGAR